MLVCPTLHGLTIPHMIIAIGLLDNQTLLLIRIVFLMGVLLLVLLLIILLGILIYAMMSGILYAKNLQTFKAPALKESSIWTNGDRQTFFDQIFNFCLHNIIVRKVLSNFCFWGPIRFVHWLEIDPVPS